MYDSRRHLAAVGLSICFGLIASDASAQTAPQAPVITEPPIDGTIVNPADVHMETQFMVDADGDDHVCSDFEIWTVTPTERVWVTACIGGVERVHTHLGDGVFENSHADLSELLYDTDYTLEVRHQDSSTMWSAWSVRSFRTGAPTAVFPLAITDILTAPVPQIKDAVGTDYVLPAGSSIRLDAVDNLLFMRFESDGLANSLIDSSGRADHADLRVVVEAGGGGISIPELDLLFTDDDGLDHVVYLSSMAVGAGNQKMFWISQNGSSFVGSASDLAPQFSTLARGNPVPWRVVPKGFRVEVVASGFMLPVNIAFPPQLGLALDAPAFYVSELYGSIKTVLRDGNVLEYAGGLLNFNPTGNFPGSGEQGLAGIVVEPVSGDLFVGLLYDAAPPNGPHYPKVIRLHSVNGGRTVSSIDTILEMPGETQGQSHFISNISIGPDGKLYVHMGDGFNAPTALDLDSFRGKVLRMEFDGTPCVDNPFYDAGDGIGARDYVWTYGLRNPFGGGWRASDGAHYSVENGPGDNDRFTRMLGGENFGWDGTVATMTIGAIYNWSPPHAPVNICFVEPETFAGSAFPSTYLDRAYVTESGPTWATGPQTRGKRVVWFDLDPTGAVTSGPNTFVEYEGVGKATAVGLAPGPDGLYFTDLYKDMDYVTPIDVGAQVLRVRWIGKVDFDISSRVGAPPFAVHFLDRSEVPDARAWHWDFGDGATSTQQSPVHTYNDIGSYDVRLEVTGIRGVIVEQKTGVILVGTTLEGVLAEIYDTIDLSGPALTRIDPNIDFNWGSGSPDPAISNDDFSVRWTGQISVPATDTWTFTTRSDDGVRLWIDGVIVIDQWIDQPPTEHTGSIALGAGVHDVRVEYYENGGGALMQLSWESSGLVREIVPTTSLSPVAFPNPTDAPPSFAATALRLHPNRPNPFNPRTVLEFETDRAGRAWIDVFDLRGRHVASLADATRVAAGVQQTSFDGNDHAGRKLASGAYLYRVRFVPFGSVESFEATGRMVLIK